MNWVFLIGHLGREPELRTTKTGKAVCRFSLATRRYGRDEPNTPNWHRIVTWERTAVNCAERLSQGSKVAVVGRVDTSSYTDPEGKKKWSTDIVASRVEFLDPTPSGVNFVQKSNGSGDQTGEDTIPF